MSKDAKEYARAKMYYGEGAGTRRKLIDNKVAENSKDKYYKEAFDFALIEQDMNKHSKTAVRERKLNDFKDFMKPIAKPLIAAAGIAQ